MNAQSLSEYVLLAGVCVLIAIAVLGLIVWFLLLATQVLFQLVGGAIICVICLCWLGDIGRWLLMKLTLRPKVRPVFALRAALARSCAGQFFEIAELLP